MADKMKRGSAAGQPSSMRNVSCDAYLDAAGPPLLDSSDGQQRPLKPKLQLNLSMARSGIDKPNEDLSSSSGENFFQGFRLQFPGFSKHDPTTGDCSDSDDGCRTAGTEASRIRDNSSGGRDDQLDVVVPATPSPVLLLNKKRLYHVPSRLKTPRNASKKLRLESANCAHPTSRIVEENPSSGPVEKPKAPFATSGESGQEKNDAKPSLLRTNSVDADNRVLDETLASFREIVADTSKIMEKLCSERKAPPLPNSKGDGARVPEEKPRVSDQAEAVKEQPPVVPEEERDGNAGIDAHSTSSRSKTNADKGENSSRADTESPRLGSERSRSDITLEKCTKPTYGVSSPNFHWPSPSSNLKVAVVNPLLKLNSGTNFTKASSAPNRVNDMRQGSATRPTSSHAAHRDDNFLVSSDDEGDISLPSSSRPLGITRRKNRLPLISSSSDSDSHNERIESLRRKIGRSNADLALIQSKMRQQEREIPKLFGQKPHHPPRHSFGFSSSSEEEADRGKRCSRARQPSMHDTALSPRWRMAHGQQDAASAYRLEDARSPRCPKQSGGDIRRHVRIPGDWEMIETSSGEDSGLEVLTHVKPSKNLWKKAPKLSEAAKDKRKYQTFPVTGDAYVSPRPGTSRMFDERPLRTQRIRGPAAEPRSLNGGKSELTSSELPTRGPRRFQDYLQEEQATHGNSGSRTAKSKSLPSKARNCRTTLPPRNDDFFDDPELSSDEVEDAPRPRRSTRSRGTPRRSMRILSSSDTDDDEVEVPFQRRQPQRRRERGLPVGGMRFRRIVGDVSSEEERTNREGSASPAFNGDVAESALAPGCSGYCPKKTVSGRAAASFPARLESPGEVDAVHQIQQIETDEAYARRLQAEFDAEVNAVAPPPQPPTNSPPVERTFNPVRAGPSTPHRYSRSRNPSQRAVNAAGSLRNSRPRQVTARTPNQQSLLNASRHRAGGGRMRGSPSYDAMAMLPMLEGSHFNRMLLGFQDEWMSLIARVSVPTVESDPEETSRGRSPRALRRRPAARANASSDDTDIDGITFESLLTYSDDEDDYWQAGIRPSANQTGRTGARRRSRGRRVQGNYWTPNQGNDYEELLELAERLGHVSRGLNRTQINRLPTHQFSKADGNGGESVTRTTECHICMSEYENGERLRILPCFHDFHTNCIDRWLREKNTCPVCRLRVQVS